MKKLALHFVVAPTSWNPRTSHQMMCASGAWVTCERAASDASPPGLLRRRVTRSEGYACANTRGVGSLQNRDKTECATNIGLQFVRLLQGKPPIRAMDDAELEFHRFWGCAWSVAMCDPWGRRLSLPKSVTFLTSLLFGTPYVQGTCAPAPLASTAPVTLGGLVHMPINRPYLPAR